ncbi:endonuclease/exonuclease/phosphatase family protein [uncultured Litoreibacter sp.]|uniref:endonuclease/exonuclease/phosphatase family protein n=1 Tax=uncultured Litoreibacter sp. TaxID=1392394 RepID=UPI0026086082|nr:endonuclease/exonuclease/phosphatase family protein [uncultured Litoreibacter sp.]
MTYNAGLSRKGPGLLVRDLDRFEVPALRETVGTIARIKPDVLALQSIDYDHQLIALSLLQARLKEAGHEMRYAFARPPNSGVSTGLDIDRDGRLDTARDRQGYGLFSGQGGMAILSRYPIDQKGAKDLSGMLWRDLPNAELPVGYFTEDELSVLRLHSVAAWDVPIRTPGGTVRIFATQTSPPVFDGPEDRNGLRNADQLRFWRRYILSADKGAFVLLGGLNNDPYDGDGLKPELLKLLSLDAVQDVTPEAHHGFVENPHHQGPPEQDTVDWGRDIGSLRVDYVLPSAGLGVAAAAVERDQTPGEGADGTAHKPVWIDIRWK